MPSTKQPANSFSLFARRVYGIVAHIPRGKTMTYGEVARQAGNPGAARAVGTVLSKNYDPKIPCHRVIRADLPAPRPGIFYAYVILCRNGTLYIGQTNDIRKRWRQHRAGTAAAHTKKFGAKQLIHYERYKNRSDAVQREKELKTGFGRKWIKREWKAGRTRQAGGTPGGYNRGAALKEKILRRERAL